MSDGYDRAISRRRVLAAVGTAGAALLSGCSTILDSPVSATQVSAEFTAGGSGMEIVNVGGGNEVGSPRVDIEITDTLVPDIHYLAAVHDGQQVDVAVLGVQERAGRLRLREGENRVLAIAGGDLQNGSVVGGTVLTEGTITVEVHRVE